MGGGNTGLTLEIKDDKHFTVFFKRKTKSNLKRQKQPSQS